MRSIPRISVLWLAVFGVFLAPVSSWAAAPPRLVLVFAEDESQVTITDAQGRTLPIVEGLAIAPGMAIRTRASSVELQLEPNGSVLKLARETNFAVRSLQGLQNAASNDFGVLSGKIRLVAAKLEGVLNLYNVITPTAQAGVRGTDLAVEANAEEGDWVCVKEGVVEFALLAGSDPKKSIFVRSGEFANAKSPQFAVKKATPADLADKFEGLDFAQLHEADVPGHSVP